MLALAYIHSHKIILNNTTLESHGPFLRVRRIPITCIASIDFYTGGKNWSEAWLPPIRLNVESKSKEWAGFWINAKVYSFEDIGNLCGLCGQSKKDRAADES